MRLATDLPDRAAWLAPHDELAATDLRPVLPRITVPTAVLCGGRDRASLADTHTTAELVPGAHRIVIPHTGHLPTPSVFGAILAG